MNNENYAFLITLIQSIIYERFWILDFRFWILDCSNGVFKIHFLTTKILIPSLEYIFKTPTFIFCRNL